MNHASLSPVALGMQPPSAFVDHVTDELHRYNEHLRDVRGLAESTCRYRVRIVGRFLQEHFADSPIDIAQLRSDDVRSFLARQLDVHRSHSKASLLASALRSYFRYRATCGDPIGSLTTAISNPVHWKLASLPRALSHDEADHLLKSFATVRRWPRRSYAIVRCALDMGLRAGEIARLMISDIDWHAGTVTLRGTKSLRQDILPLPMETGQALADYLQYERPTTRHPAIFVRCQGECDLPLTSTAVQKVIKRACLRVGLRHSSAHALRHTLACRLVENGGSLKEVADVLRHRSLNSTLIYAKLDTPKLSAVPLPWPGSES